MKNKEIFYGVIIYFVKLDERRFLMKPVIYFGFSWHLMLVVFAIFKTKQKTIYIVLFYEIYFNI